MILALSWWPVQYKENCLWNCCHYFKGTKKRKANKNSLRQEVITILYFSQVLTAIYLLDSDKCIRYKFPILPHLTRWQIGIVLCPRGLPSVPCVPSHRLCHSHICHVTVMATGHCLCALAPLVCVSVRRLSVWICVFTGHNIRYAEVHKAYSPKCSCRYHTVMMSIQWSFSGISVVFVSVKVWNGKHLYLFMYMAHHFIFIT